MPVGYLITAGLVTVAMAVSVRPPARSGPLGMPTWFVSAIANESPFLVLYYLGLSTWLASSSLHGAGVWIAVGLTAAPVVGTPVLVRRSLRQHPRSSRHLTGTSDRGHRRPASGSARICRGHGSCSRRYLCSTRV